MPAYISQKGFKDEISILRNLSKYPVNPNHKSLNMCRFYYIPCKTERCLGYAQGYMSVCDMEPHCRVEYSPQTNFSGEQWCSECIKDGTYFAWTHLETQIRAQGVYQQWIISLSRAASSSSTAHSNPTTIAPLFTQLQALGLQPPALRYYHILSAKMLYSLPIGLQEQDLTSHEKDRIPTLLTLTASNNLAIMNRHRHEMSNFHEKLNGFLGEVGLEKLPRA